MFSRTPQHGWGDGADVSNCVTMLARCKLEMVPCLVTSPLGWVKIHRIHPSDQWCRQNEHRQVCEWLRYRVALWPAFNCMTDKDTSIHSQVNKDEWKKNHRNSLCLTSDRELCLWANRCGPRLSEGQGWNNQMVTSFMWWGTCFPSSWSWSSIPLIWSIAKHLVVSFIRRIISCCVDQTLNDEP